ncbi:serine hydrolase domain-containing protein [Phenylobacterium sp.]|jgi:CubicO group peptidase (beta-lactamase class C family)|uniref:serine hydrolase domain-containing protein n=1 Tax=Phenylobacterium sp. TaxID=1871053 RepID=UPI001209B302|nr:serine hydrolase domain-containing protein [Phenylobacterium sp.]THD56381.1 MAG: class A beta-lactamase-related serine hydrolase [Phenylobacterium sp.]
MRSIVFAVAAAVLLLAPQAGAFAQDDTAPPEKHAAPAPSLPKAPIPYIKLHPKPAKPKPKVATPAATATAPATAAAPPKPATVPAAQGPIVHAESAPPALPADEGVAAAPAPAPAPPPPPQPAGPPAPTARLSAGQAIPAAELEAFADGLLKDAMAREHIAGVTVSVVQNGQVVLKKGYGFASLNPQRAVDPDKTLFRVGSISKTFTWIALMKEVEAGRIRLNQPVNLYLPEKVQVKDQGYDQPVRVANLMDHSAGFEDRALGQLFERNYGRVRPLDLYLRQERPKRVHAPGAVSSYSNYGAALAGEAVTYTSGKPYERLIEDEILNPLGMAHTTFREPHDAKAGLPAPMSASLAGDVSDGYRWTPLGFARRDYEFIGQIAPAGAGSSTAGDMARYMLMQLSGGQIDGTTIYNPTTAQAFRTPLRKTPEGINGWAHGFMVFDLPGGHRGYGHGGATLSFFSNMVVIPDLNLGVFISTNTATGRPLATRFPELIVQHFYAAPEPFPRAGSPELAQRSGDFAGYYQTTRRAYSGLEGFVDQLKSGAAVDVSHGGQLTVSDAGGVRTFVPEGPPDDGRFIASQGSERIAFDLAQGGARAFHVANGTQVFERAPFWREPTILELLTALAGFTALITLIGVGVRNRREFRENQIQTRASLVQNIQAVLWLVAFGLFGLWLSRSGDQAEVMYRWPGVLMITASACALVAAGLTATTVLVLPAIWRGGRRVDSWSPLRKAFFTLTVLVYAAFSVDLALWGALSPWSG